MILGDDKARLSKRHGATSVMAYQELGFLPETLVNCLARLSWSHGDQEIFTREELIRLFDLDAVGKSAAVFDSEKLLWLNQHYIKECPTDRLAAAATEFWKKENFPFFDKTISEQAAADLKSRSKTIVEMAKAGAFYFQDELVYEEDAAQKFLVTDAVEPLRVIQENLPALADYTKSGIDAFLRATAESCGIKMKFIAQPLRVALSGKTTSPGLDEMMITLGKARVLKRIAEALSFIEKE